MISSNNLTIDVVAPTSISSGEERSIGLSIVNGNRTDLEGATLFITYPEGAEKVGKLLGERLKAAGVESVVFDRAGYKYHGRVKALADAIRAEGIQF